MTSEKCNLKLDWATYEAAKFACEHWHYSKCMPKSKLTKIGVWEDGSFVGVVIFSCGANQNIYRPFGVGKNEACELTRVALSQHKTSVSKILSVAIKMMHLANPKMRIIISYADTGQNHLGSIYQASNWCYVGYYGGERNVSVSGITMHRRTAYSRYGTTRPDGSVNIEIPGKHKYVYLLDKSLMRCIEQLRKPYPKRVSSIVSDATGNQLVEGGATPTGTLQTLGVANG